jgi:cytochrome o ubiquinol oxidase operon protein cyoD
MAGFFSTRPNTALIAYVLGFVFSGLLTLESYILAAHGILSGNQLIAALLLLAVTQLVVQLVFFLHIGQETKPRWNLVFLLNTAGLILLVVLGSLWIMYHLNYLMMPSDINHYLMDQEAIYK